MPLVFILLVMPTAAIGIGALALQFRVRIPGASMLCALSRGASASAGEAYLCRSLVGTVHPAAWGVQAWEPWDGLGPLGRTTHSAVAVDSSI